MLRQLIFGDVGRAVNSFVAGGHPDAIAWQRQFRMSLYTTRSNREALMTEIKGPVYLVSSKHFCRKYSHAIRAPHIGRAIGITHGLNEQDKSLLAKGGLPKQWWPRCVMVTLLRYQRGSAYLLNNYPDEDPLPWNPCRNDCCGPTKISRNSSEIPKSLDIQKTLDIHKTMNPNMNPTIMSTPVTYINTGRRYHKNMLYNDRRQERRYFKKFRRGNRNPARANRHVYTNKDMRFW